MRREKMVRFSEEQIIDNIIQRFEKRIALLAPLIRGRKGHYRELFEQVRKQRLSEGKGRWRRA